MTLCNFIFCHKHNHLFILLTLENLVDFFLLNLFLWFDHNFHSNLLWLLYLFINTSKECPLNIHENFRDLRFLNQTGDMSVIRIRIRDTITNENLSILWFSSFLLSKDSLFSCRMYSFSDPFYINWPGSRYSPSSTPFCKLHV